MACKITSQNWDTRLLAVFPTSTGAPIPRERVPWRSSSLLWFCQFTVVLQQAVAVRGFLCCFLWVKVSSGGASGPGQRRWRNPHNAISSPDLWAGLDQNKGCRKGKPGSSNWGRAKWFGVSLRTSLGLSYLKKQGLWLELRDLSWSNCLKDKHRNRS